MKNKIELEPADQDNKVETRHSFTQNTWKYFGNVYFWSTYIE